MTDTVSSIILKGMKKQNCRYVFGLPAAQLGVFMDGASRDPYFKYVTTRHEEAAGHMAHAVSKLTDSIGVCFGTVGPGAMNLVPGVAAAWADNVPLIAITGNNQSNVTEPGADLLQNSNQCETYKTITKWSTSLRDPQRTVEIFERAVYLAKSGRPGPVHLDIPCDIGTHACNLANSLSDPIDIPRPVPSPSEMESIVNDLLKARRPVIIAGGGVARSRGEEALRLLLERTEIPATTTLNGRGLIDVSYPFHLGSGAVLGGTPVTRALKEADVILAVGCKFSTWTPVSREPLDIDGVQQKIIQIEIDPSHMSWNAPVTSGFVGDANAFLAVLHDALAGKSLSIDETWRQSLMDERAAYRNVVEAIADAKFLEGTQTLNEAVVARQISKSVPPDAIFVLDGGQIMEWSQTFLNPRDAQSYFFNPGMGHLGFGQPAANAAKLAHPDRPVICVTGDGAMGCTIQELETAARHGLNTVTIVCNDSNWGMYQPLGRQVFDNNDFGTDLTTISFSDIAKGFGCYGERVDDIDDLPSAVTRALEADKPAVIEIRVGFTLHPMDDFWLHTVLKGIDFKPATI